MIIVPEHYLFFRYPKSPARVTWIFIPPTELLSTARIEIGDTPSEVVSVRFPRSDRVTSAAERIYRGCDPRISMDADAHRVVAVWAVLTVPFLLIAAYLWSQADLAAQFVIAFWFAPFVLTLIGAIPGPWEVVTG